MYEYTKRIDKEKITQDRWLERKWKATGTPPNKQTYLQVQNSNMTPRLREVSNFGDSGEIHVSAPKWAPSRRRATRGGQRVRVFRRNRQNQ